MRIDTTIKPVSPFGRPVFEAEDLFIVLTTKEIIIMPWRWVGGSKHYSVSSHPPNASAALRRLVPNRTVKRGCLVSSTSFSWICCFMCALSSSQVPVFERPSAPESATRLSWVSWGHAKWGHTWCIDWDQLNWNSDMAWMAKCDVGQLSAQIG